MEAGRSSTLHSTHLEGPILMATAAAAPSLGAGVAATATYQYSPATSRRLSVPSLLEDPYERGKVEVGR